MATPPTPCNLCHLECDHQRGPFAYVFVPTAGFAERATPASTMSSASVGIAAGAGVRRDLSLTDGVMRDIPEHTYIRGVRISRAVRGYLIARRVT